MSTLAGRVPEHRPGRARQSIGRARWLASPPTGWLSALLLLLMLATAGLAIDVPRLARVGPGGSSQTAFLPWVMVIAGVVGIALARTRLPVPLAHLLGASAGVAVLLFAWSGAISDAVTVQERLSDVNRAAATLFDDVVAKRGRTEQTIGFLIVIGAIAWTTGQFAAFNLVRRGVVAPAIVAIGTFVLVVALAPAVEESAIQEHLVVLTGLSLLLVLRAGLAHQQAGWRRRHILGGRDAEAMFLRAGTVLSVVALAGATLLAANVVASPLRESFASLDQRLLDLATTIDGLFGRSGTSTATGAYADLDPITDSWSESQVPRFTWTSPDGRPQYWRGAAYSRFVPLGWTRDRTARSSAVIPAGQDPLGASVDSVASDAAGRRDDGYVLLNRGLDGRTLLSPATPLSVDRDTLAVLDGDGGPFLQIDLRDQLGLDEGYTLLVRSDRRGEDGLTQNRLAAAGVSYPTWVEPYIEVVPGTLSELAKDAASRIANADPARRTPFHVAQRLEAWFADSEDDASGEPRFTYETDLSGLCRPAEGVVDCLLRTGKGFCKQYATAMTLMLRSQGIPARYVLGFLPGQQQADGSWVVPAAAAHAWVEVFFPGSGWVRFDPTPGGNAVNGQQTSRLPEGPPVPTPTPSVDEPLPTPVFSDPPTPTPDPAVVTPPPSDPPGADDEGLDGSIALLGLLLVGLALATGVVLASRRLRGIPGRDANLLYRAIAGLATRVGHGPTPSQTPYEFTARLGEVVPGAGADLRAVARGKVEATYGRRPPDGDAMDALVASYRRARQSLMAFVFRIRSRP